MSEALPTGGSAAGAGLLRADRPRRRRGGLRRRRELTGIAMALPAVLVLALFFLLPLVLTFWISLHTWPLLGRHVWAGLANYTRAVHDAEFRTALWFTVKYTLITTPVLFLIGLGLALLIRRRTRGAAVFQTVYFLPVVIGFASASFLFKFLFQGGVGQFISLLARIGLVSNNTNWFAGSLSALTIVVGMVTWKFVGLQMLLLLTGLQGIPDEVQEASKIDGAGSWGNFRFVTLPLLRPTLALVLVFSVAGSLLAFDQFYIVTSGGPDNSTITAVYEIYRVSFIRFQLGYGAALSVILMVILAVVSAVQLLLLRNSDNS
jgi:multiple sugar transport system permease protein